MTAPAWLTFERDGTRLACRDFGGDGPPALLLHGLAGHASEWADTAGWLTATHRVLALDARGHGRSERWPVPFPTREASVAHFGGPSVSADAWTAGLEQREDGLRPAFDLDVMERSLREAVAEFLASAAGPARG